MRMPPGVTVSNSYTFRILDSNDLVPAAIEASIAIDAQYVIGLVSQYISWAGTMDFVVEIRPASELTWSDADGLLPSFVQLGWTGNGWTNQTITEAVTGIDLNPGRPDVGLTIYLADDGTIKNYGAPVWFDPNPGFESASAVPAGMHDFVGIMIHETFHSLGFINYTQEWTSRLVTQGGVSYFTGQNSAALFGGPIPFQAGYDHYGYAQDPSIPINRGLMYQFGNYERNRWDIGRIDLAILADLGYTIKSYDGLSLFEFIDTATDLSGTGAGEALYGDYHANVLSGLGGDDRIEGGAGSDQLSGGDGNDLLTGGSGVDSFDGGANTTVRDPVTVYGDRISFAEPRATQGAVADLRTGIISNDGFGNSETMANVESIGAGTAFADTFHGNDGRNALLGSRGDTLNGFGGDDIILVTAAPAGIAGGTGFDLLELFSGGGFYLPDSDGDGLAQTAPAMTSGWQVDLEAGTVRDGYGNLGVVGGIEDVTGSAAADSIGGDGDSNIIKGNGGGDTLFGAGGDDLIVGGAGNDDLDGGAGDDTIQGGDGDDLLEVEEEGTDIVEGGAGEDLLAVHYGDAEIDVIMTAPAVDPSGGYAGSVGDGSGRNISYSGIERFSIVTGAGADVVYGGNGWNFALLGSGDDHYISALSAGNYESVDGGEGIDGLTVDRSDNPTGAIWNLGGSPPNVGDYQRFEYFVSLTTGDGQDAIGTTQVERSDNITLGANSDSVTLWNGHDTVNGGKAGAGGTNSGFDTLVLNYGQATTGVRNIGALTSDAAGYSGKIGDDSTRSATFQAIDRFLVATGSGNDNITTGIGNDEIRTGGGNDVLDGGGGNDLLDGGSGDDSMTGGAGNDIFVVSSAGDAVIEQAGEGVDEVMTALAVYSLAGVANVEKLTGTSSAEQDLTANAGNNVVTAGGGADVLHLEAGGDDIVFGGDGNDSIHFGESLRAADQVDGGAGFDTLFLHGNYAAGVTLLPATLKNVERITLLHFGQSGYTLFTNDSNVAAGQVLAIDASGLGAFETLSFHGEAETDGAFNITGGAAMDILFGGAGDDVFSGGGGSDRFFGGGGADTMIGGADDDYYQVTEAGDSVVEAAGEGVDHISTNLAVFSLAATPHVENLGGGRAEGQTLTGNALANIITGFHGNDVIDGGSGADEMRGGLGDDLYHVDDSGDRAFEAVSEGTDEIRTGLASFSLSSNPNVFNVENLTGTSANGQTLTGSAANNVVTGGSGNDVLRLQHGGDDTVFGGAGNDSIFFIGALTGADVVNGGDGGDTLVLQGAYGALTLTANVTQIENISILAGSNTAFGEPGTNRYDYGLTIHDANFAAGVQARINAG
ncbi:MAG TPA: calcium-binding protein, partial [Allosphingosinicella sp.]